jgi:hypothetical protein
MWMKFPTAAFDKISIWRFLTVFTHTTMDAGEKIKIANRQAL